MKKAFAMAVLTLTLFSLGAPAPASAGVSGHALVKFFSIFGNLQTLKDAVVPVLFVVEEGVDVVHAGTAGLKRGSISADHAVEAFQAKLAGAKTQPAAFAAKILSVPVAGLEAGIDGAVVVGTGSDKVVSTIDTGLENAQKDLTGSSN